MYDWRKMTAAEREQALAIRKAKRHPWHGPPHRPSDTTSLYLISAACYEHQPIIGFSFERMVDFESNLLDALTLNQEQVFAWCILPNHYHALIDSANILATIHGIGHLHGQTSHQ
jgi:putative transposase